MGRQNSRSGSTTQYNLDYCVDFLRFIQITASLHKQYNSYRKVFIKTPRPDISEGLYVALESYWREGEMSANKSGWGAAQQHVIYRKYIRFLPNKQLFIHCSPDNPKTILRKLMGPDFMQLKGLAWTSNQLYIYTPYVYTVIVYAL